jgi:hypothetical protein
VEARRRRRDARSDQDLSKIRATDPPPLRRQ